MCTSRARPGTAMSVGARSPKGHKVLIGPAFWPYCGVVHLQRNSFAQNRLCQTAAPNVLLCRRVTRPRRVSVGYGNITLRVVSCCFSPGISPRGVVDFTNGG